MFRTISFIVYLLLSLGVSAHEFYFSFAEIEIDDLSGRIEATISITTHDLEKALVLNGISEKKLSGNENDSLFQGQLESVLNKGLQIRVDERIFEWSLEGYEVQLNGITHFYVSCATSQISNSLTMTFDLLMKDFPEQQNKATIIYRGKKGTYVFLPGRKEQTILLSDLQ